MSAILARNKINLLDIKCLNGEYYILFEFCYYNKDRSKTWAKDICRLNEQALLDGSYAQRIVDAVNAQKAELER